METQEKTLWDPPHELGILATSLKSLSIVLKRLFCHQNDKLPQIKSVELEMHAITACEN